MPEIKKKLYQAKVRWFNKHKGYGFLAGGQSRDIFFHYSMIPGDAKFKALKPGQVVRYRAKTTPLGKRVKELEIVEG